MTTLTLEQQENRSSKYMFTVRMGFSKVSFGGILIDPVENHTLTEFLRKGGPKYNFLECS